MPSGTPQPQTHQVRSFCRFCSALCGIVVTVEGDQVRSVRGDPDHPLSAGYTCPKGRALGAWHHHPHRLDHPTIGRREARLPARWDECLDDLATRIADLAAARGPDSVGMYLATASSFDAAGGRVANRLLGALGSRSRYTAVTIDTPCRPLVADLMGGTPTLMPCLDPASAGLTLLVGTNPVVSHGHTTSMPDPVARLRGLAAPPRELWVLDPRRTETARLASRHLAPRPGSDHAVFAYLVRELLGPGGGADRKYLRDHAEGVERLAAAVAPWDLARASRETGLAPGDLEDLVAACRRYGRVAAVTGTGTTMSRTANVTEWLVWALQVVTGSYERPGGLWFNPGFLRCFDRRTLRPSPAEPGEGPGPASRPDLPGFYGEIPCAALADEIEAGNLRALIVVGGNPATALPESDRLEAVLGRLDVLAVADVVHTETTALATHVLPCTGQLERSDVPDYVDQYYSAVASQHTGPVVAPGAGRRPLWWACAQLGARLGHRLLPEDLDPDAATDDDVLATFADRGRRRLHELVEAPTAIVHEGPVRGWVHERVLPGGRWRVAPRVLVEDLGRHLAASGGAGPHPLVLVPRRQLRTLNSQLRDVAAPGSRGERPLVHVHPDDALAAGLADGDGVHVSSSHGSTTGKVRIDVDLAPGTVSVPHGWDGPRVGALTSGSHEVDPLTGMVLQSGVPVRLSPAGGDGHDRVTPGL